MLQFVVDMWAKIFGMGKNKTERQELHEERREASALERIADLLERFLFPPASGFKILQGDNMAITGIVKGAVGNFSETPTPAGGQLQAGNIPVWTSDDPLTTLTPSADGTTVAVATSATDPATSFNLTVSGVASDGTKITGTANVPLTAAVVPATGFAINQL
jgi:hypothetical protein